MRAIILMLCAVALVVAFGLDRQRVVISGDDVQVSSGSKTFDNVWAPGEVSCTSTWSANSSGMTCSTVAVAQPGSTSVVVIGGGGYGSSR